MVRSICKIAVALVLVGCSEGPQPFSLEEYLPDTTGGTRLTYSPGRDRAPAWNKTGDSIYYSAEGIYLPLPQSRGVMLSIPARGGKAQIMLRPQQLGLVIRFLSGGVVAPAGNNLAYFEFIAAPAPKRTCTMFCTVSEDTTFTETLLERGVLRITPTTADALDSDSLHVPIVGRFFDSGHSHYNLGGHWVLTAYPFQRMMLRSGAQPFRPSWSPDGRRIVFSDGLRLMIYDLQTRQAVPVPGTNDAVYPAWSPTGDRIAYTRLLRSDSTVTECLCFSDRGGILEEQRRVIFNEAQLGLGALMLVNPDGSDTRVLGPGDMPTWGPDGSYLVFRRGQQLWRAGADGTEAQPIALTQGAEEPAVSPDGRWVAFVRPMNTSGGSNPGQLNYDIWVVPLRIE